MVSGSHQAKYLSQDLTRVSRVSSDPSQLEPFPGVELLSASIRLRLGAMFLPVKNAARGPKQANSSERLRFNAVCKISVFHFALWGERVRRRA